MSAAKVTTDHNKIRKWVEERNGRPTSVKGTEKGKEESGLLRIDFPGYSGGDSLEEISWDEFFRKLMSRIWPFCIRKKIKMVRRVDFLSSLIKTLLYNKG